MAWGEHLGVNKWRGRSIKAIPASQSVDVRHRGHLQAMRVLPFQDGS